MLKKIGIGCGAVVAIIVSVAGSGNGEDAQRPGVSPTPVPTPLTVTARQIFEDYEANEVAAESRYEGNWALITGTISSITEAGSQYDVKLETAKLFSVSNVVCKVDKEYDAEILSLTAGQTITVLGKIRGRAVIDFNVDECRVQ